MAITYGNVDNWLKKSNVKGFALTAYPTPGKPYTFNLKHTVVGNRADVYQTKLVSDIVPQLPGGAQGQAGTLTFSRKSLAAAAKVLMIASYDGPDGA